MRLSNSLEEMIKNFKFESQQKTFCGESTVRPFLFENYVRIPSIESAFRHHR